MYAILLLMVLMMTGCDRAGSHPLKPLLKSDAETMLRNSAEANSVSLSEEHPLEDYVYDNDGTKTKSFQMLRSSCSRKTKRFCEKSCRRAYKEVCSEYECRSSVRSKFRRACKRHCKPYYWW